MLNGYNFKGNNATISLILTPFRKEVLSEQILSSQSRPHLQELSPEKRARACVCVCFFGWLVVLGLTAL